MHKFLKYILVTCLGVSLLAGCREKYTPKPHGFFRISFPEKSYRMLDTLLPYKFEIPVYSYMEKDSLAPDEPDWINILVPANKAEIHFSYYRLDRGIDGNKGKITETGSREMLARLMEDSRELAYKHTIKADAIDEQIYINPDNKVYGTVYHIEGNAASPMQFFLTDSTENFLRGSLYIREVPNIDSLKPVIDFLKSDIIRMIESTEWKASK